MSAHNIKMARTNLENVKHEEFNIQRFDIDIANAKEKNCWLILPSSFNMNDDLHIHGYPPVAWMSPRIFPG